MTERGEPRWLTRTMVRFIHAAQVREHGGSLGLRDEGLLESALERARNRWHYGEVEEMEVLAAAYGYGMVAEAPFEGGEGAAFQAMYVFLGLNGLRIEAPEPEVVGVMTSVADGSLDEEGLAGWVGERAVARG